MRCQTCDYPLWNLNARQCPECGVPFTPSEFEFVASSVRFCCPHCEQDYYGTGEQGHLIPIEFDCVRCGNHIHMDAMILRPTEGLDEKDTRTDFNPWLERHRNGRIKSWLKTIGWALVAPGRLIRATDRDASTWQAWWFAIVTSLAMASVGAAIAMLFMLLLMPLINQGGGPGPVNMLSIFGMSVIVVIAGVFIGTFISIGIWGGLVHGLLAITGRLEEGIGRTYQCMCYSSGANVASVLFIMCGGQYFGWVWWAVSAIIMLKTAHRVHGGRASLAVLTLPVSFIVLVIGFYTYLFMVLIPQSGQMSTTITTSMSTSFDTTMLTKGIVEYAAEHDGEGPGHALELMKRNDVSATNFIPFTGAGRPQEALFPQADLTFPDLMFDVMDEDRVAQRAAAMMGENVIAHRVGDFVFTYHGLDLNVADKGLWVLILAPIDVDQVTNLNTTEYIVGYADGSTESISLDDFKNFELNRQNDLRALEGLPPLPEPKGITQSNPAVAPR